MSLSDLLKPEILQILVPIFLALIVTGGICVVSIAWVIWQTTKIQQAQNSLSKQLIELTGGEIKGIRDEFVNAEAAQTTELKRQTAALQDMREDRKGDHVFMESMLNAMKDFSRDTTDAVASWGKKTGTNLEEGRKEIIEEVDQQFAEALSASIENQNKVGERVLDVLSEAKTELLTPLTSIDEKVTSIGLNVHEIPQWQQTMNDIVRHVANMEMMLAQQKETNELLIGLREDLKVIKRDLAILQAPPPSFDTVATAAVLVKRDSKPIPPMPPLDTPITDVAQPPSLVTEHAAAKVDSDPTPVIPPEAKL